MGPSLFVSVVLANTVILACSRGVPPAVQEGSMSSVVVLVGQDVDFTCGVSNLGNHMVAFIKSESPPRLLTFDEKVFRRRDKYELKPRVGNGNNEWVLTIKNVQESDRGNYSCQINTEPVTITTGHLDVKVPPIVSRTTPAAVEVREGHNVTLACKADGNPTPSVVWRRQDRQIIRYNGATGFGASVFHGPSLHLTKISRKHMSEYICVASNGIPPDESWTVKLLVTFPPMVQAQTNEVSASRGSMTRIVCTTEAWPRPEVTWQKDGEPIFDNELYSMSHTVSGQYHSVHILEIRQVQRSHFGTYRCNARNDNGKHHADIVLKEKKHDEFLHTNVLSEGSGDLADDEDIGAMVDEMVEAEERTAQISTVNIVTRKSVNPGRYSTNNHPGDWVSPNPPDNLNLIHTGTSFRKELRARSCRSVSTSLLAAVLAVVHLL